MLEHNNLEALGWFWAVLKVCTPKCNIENNYEMYNRSPILRFMNDVKRRLIK